MRKNTKKIVALGTIVSTGLVAVGFLIWISVSTTTSFFTGDNKNNQQSGQIHETKKVKAEDITSAIRQSLAKKYTLVDFNDPRDLSESEVGFKTEKISPPHKLSGETIYTNYDGGSTINLFSTYSSTLPSSIDKELRTHIATVFTGDFALRKTGTTGSVENGNSIDIYQNDTVVCVIESRDSSVQSSTASCGELDKYAPFLSTIRPIVNSIPGVDKDSVFTAPLTVVETTVEGVPYARASISQYNINGGGSRSILYKKASGSWIFFASTQQPLECSAYISQDLQNAFRGEVCFEINGTEGVVGGAH